MAIIDNESKTYSKIDLEGCFANIHGLYISVAEYVNKSDRDKEKSRILEFNEFLEKTIPLIESNVSELEDNEDDDLFGLSVICDNFSQIVYVVSGTDQFIPDDNIIDIAKKYGFKREWIEDPIHIKSTYIIRAKDYELDGFDIEDLYGKLKARHAQDGIIFTDDL